MNKLEEKVYNWLKENNIVFEYSPIMQDYDGTNYQFDFIIKGKRILIECNGTYWHSSLFKDKTYHYLSRHQLKFQVQCQLIFY